MTTTGTLPRDLCGGAIHLPGDPGYDAARAPWNLAADLRPAAVAYPSNTAELAETVTAAREAGLRVAVQGTGHAAGTLGDLSDVVLIRTSGMNKVSVDAGAQLVRAQAGALWDDVVTAVAPYGLTVLHGSSPDVGVVGYTLGGGLGWYGRSLGLAAHSLTGATVVTSSGEIIAVDEHTHPDLLWALRGGAGGNFAVVAEIEFRAYPFDEAYAGMLVWDLSRGEEVLRAWERWTRTAPDCVTTSFRFLRIPPIPEIPEPFRGRNLVVIDGAVSDFRGGHASDVEADEAARQILAPLRALEPEMDTFARVPTATLTRLHMDPEGPSSAVTNAVLLSELSEKSLAELLAAAGPSVQTPVLVTEVRHLGGVLGRPAAVDAALSHLAAPYALFTCAMLPAPEFAVPFRAECDRIVEAMTPWHAGQYLNFAEEAVDASTAFSAEHWQRLQDLRFKWDPDEALVASHAIAARRPDFGG